MRGQHHLQALAGSLNRFAHTFRQGIEATEQFVSVGVRQRGNEHCRLAQILFGFLPCALRIGCAEQLMAGKAAGLRTIKGAWLNYPARRTRLVPFGQVSTPYTAELRDRQSAMGNPLHDLGAGW